MEQVLLRLRRFQAERDWNNLHTAKDLAISISIEAAELLEIFQWRKETAEIDKESADQIRGEVADVFLYLLLLCDHLGIDIVKAAEAKILLNEARFPVSRDDVTTMSGGAP